MIQKFLDYIAIERKYSPRTVQTYRDDLYEFCRHLGWEPEEYDVSAVTEGDVKEWIISLMEENHNAPRSVKQKLAALHSFYRFLLRLGIVEKDITRRVIAPKVDKPLPVFFKTGEMEEATAWDEAADDFLNILNQGALFTTYFGHGSKTDWASEGLLKPSYLVKLTNKGRYTILGSFSCTVGRFDEGNARSLSEEFLIKAGAGSIVSIGATRETFAEYNFNLGKNLLLNSLRESGETIGSAFLKNLKFTLFLPEHVRPHTGCSRC